jgi:hypothetical protein
MTTKGTRAGCTHTHTHTQHTRHAQAQGAHRVQTTPTFCVTRVKFTTSVRLIFKSGISDSSARCSVFFSRCSWGASGQGTRGKGGGDEELRQPARRRIGETGEGEGNARKTHGKDPREHDTNAVPHLKVLKKALFWALLHVVPEGVRVLQHSAALGGDMR